jgi:hypothetical protein
MMRLKQKMKTWKMLKLKEPVMMKMRMRKMMTSLMSEEVLERGLEKNFKMKMRMLLKKMMKRMKRRKNLMMETQSLTKREEINLLKQIKERSKLRPRNRHLIRKKVRPLMELMKMDQSFARKKLFSLITYQMMSLRSDVCSRKSRSTSNNLKSNSLRKRILRKKRNSK